MRRLILQGQLPIALFLLLALGAGCSNEADPAQVGTDGDTDTAADGDSDTDSDGDSDTDTDTDSDTDTDADTDSEECSSQVVAIFRDFSDTHPDFESFAGNSIVPGLVESQLGPDQKPVFASTGLAESPDGQQQITSAATFAQWYNTIDGVNAEYIIEIPLVAKGGGNFEFDDQTFFPIDDVTEPAAYEGRANNYHFTTEMHLKFVYKGGELFIFQGDDDLWMFINGKLAMDIGGLHEPRLGTVALDELGLTLGNTYNMDIFHAERHTGLSTFHMTTTIQCIESIIVIE